jgi:hypothetical protein
MMGPILVKEYLNIDPGLNLNVEEVLFELNLNYSSGGNDEVVLDAYNYFIDSEVECK